MNKSKREAELEKEVDRLLGVIKSLITAMSKSEFRRFIIGNGFHFDGSKKRTLKDLGNDIKDSDIGSDTDD